MKAAAWLAGTGLLLVVADLAARLAGLAEHTSVLAGMPVSNASWLIGPALVILHLGAVVLAPPLMLAGVLAALVNGGRAVANGLPRR